MGLIYQPIRIITLVACATLFVANLVDLIELAKQNNPDKMVLAVEGIFVVTVFIGAWGSYKHDRNYLLTCALIFLINVVVGIFAKNFPYYSTGGSVLLIVLTVLQSELIHRSYH